MSTISTIMTKLAAAATAFQFDFGSGSAVVFQTVKAYTLNNFNEAVKDLLVINRPALVIVYGGSTYEPIGGGAVDSNAKRVHRRKASFIFFVTDISYGFEQNPVAGFGGGSVKGVVPIMDAWRDYLCSIDPKADWSLSLAPFTPSDDEAFPVDPEVGDAVVYTLTMRTSFNETSA